MTLLTHEEYQAIAASLNLPTGAFIDGKSCASSSGRTFDTDNPATGLSLTQITSCELADVNIAVDKGRDAFESGIWSKMHPSSRKKVLINLAKLMRRNIHELAVLESLESGKPIYDIESPRELRRLRTLRRWSHEQEIKSFFTRNARTRCTHGAGAPGRVPIPLGGH